MDTDHLFRTRPAVNDDAREIKELIFGILEEYGLKADSASTDADLEDIEANYILTGGIFDLLEDSNRKIVGTVGLFKISPFECELRKMYLHKSQRGKGFGKLLLEHALKEASRLGYKKIILETASVLKEAVELYTKYGFKEFESHHISCRCDKAYYREL